MKKFNYIRSIIKILIIFFLSAILNNSHTQLKKSVSISTTKKSQSDAKQEAQFFDIEKENEKLTENKCILQTRCTSFHFINVPSGAGIKQTGFYTTYKQSQPAPLLVPLTTAVKHYLIKQEFLI